MDNLFNEPHERKTNLKFSCPISLMTMAGMKEICGEPFTQYNPKFVGNLKNVSLFTTQIQHDVQFVKGLTEYPNCKLNSTIAKPQFNLFIEKDRKTPKTMKNINFDLRTVCKAPVR